MEILDHHVFNLKLLLNRTSGKDVASQLHNQARSMVRWTRSADSNEAAYPGLQTEEGFNKFVGVEARMCQAIQSGNFTVIGDQETDALCAVCGNLTSDGCKIRGTRVSKR